MVTNGKPPFRADHVGSLLRTRAVLDARERRRRGDIAAEDLREIENAEIARVVARQEDIGLEAVTDGEFRRALFHVDFLENLKGVVTRSGIPIMFRTAADGTADGIEDSFGFRLRGASAGPISRDKQRGVTCLFL